MILADNFSFGLVLIQVDLKFKMIKNFQTS